VVSINAMLVPAPAAPESFAPRWGDAMPGGRRWGCSSRLEEANSNSNSM
jgi:hypothetical protein